MSENITFYWSESCSTCQKAKRFLDRFDNKNYTLRDIKESPLSLYEVVKLVEKLGGAEHLFSRRAVKYREMKLGERELSETEMIDLMASEYTFLKRPVLAIGDHAVAGFFEKQFEDFIYKYHLKK